MNNLLGIEWSFVIGRTGNPVRFNPNYKQNIQKCLRTSSIINRSFLSYRDWLFTIFFISKFWAEKETLQDSTRSSIIIWKNKEGKNDHSMMDFIFHFSSAEESHILKGRKNESWALGNYFP